MRYSASEKAEIIKTVEGLERLENSPMKSFSEQTGEALAFASQANPFHARYSALHFLYMRRIRKQSGGLFSRRLGTNFGWRVVLMHLKINLPSPNPYGTRSLMSAVRRLSSLLGALPEKVGSTFSVRKCEQAQTAMRIYRHRNWRSNTPMRSAIL